MADNVYPRQHSAYLEHGTRKYAKQVRVRHTFKKAKRSSEISTGVTRLGLEEYDLTAMSELKTKQNENKQTKQNKKIKTP